MIAQGRIGYEFEEERPSGSDRLWVRLARPVLQNPRDTVAAVIGVAAIAAVLVNSLYMQSGPHPAPIFAIRPLPIAPTEATGALTLPPPRPRPPAAEAARFETVPLPRPRVPQVSVPDQHGDPIADLINSNRQLSAVQRALNEFGYGPIKVSGTVDDKTRLAIEQFERDHNLPVTGQMSARFRRELASATGRSLD